MYKKWIALGFIGIFLIGGGFVVRGMQYDTPALKDSFTRDFIIQDEQAPEGFHVFESKIGTYKMLFPSDFNIVGTPSDAYGRQGDHFELWTANLKSEENSIISLKGTFQDLGDEQVNDLIDDLKFEHGRKKHYELYEQNNLIIFLEKMVKIYDEENDEMVLGDPEKVSANVYYGFVADKSTSQTLELDYSIVCPDKCSINEEEELEFMKTMLESVEFKSSMGNKQ